MPKPLSIGYDAKRAACNTTGLGNYSRRVIDEISALHPDWELTLYTPRLRGDLLGTALSRRNCRLVMPEGAWRHASSLWRVRRGITSRLGRDGLDLYHGLSNELPLDIRRSGVPSVVTIHDVIYRRCPDNYSAIDRRIYDYKYGRSARNATRVVAISRRTAADIVEFYNIDPAKIDVIYQSCHPQFSQPVSESAIARLRAEYPGLPKRYMAMVGTIERRKNQILAVRALPKIDSEVSLVIVGRGRQGYDEEVRREAIRLGVASRVQWIGGVDFTLLPAIYSQAEVAVYVSRYEGYGLPVVEAISSGTPVVAATGSCLEEAGGPGASYVDPDDPDEFAQAANELLENPFMRKVMVAAGQAHIERMLATPMADALTATYFRTLES